MELHDATNEQLREELCNRGIAYDMYRKLIGDENHSIYTPGRSYRLKHSDQACHFYGSDNGWTDPQSIDMNGSWVFVGNFPLPVGARNVFYRSEPSYESGYFMFGVYNKGQNAEQSYFVEELA